MLVSLAAALLIPAALADELKAGADLQSTFRLGTDGAWMDFHDTAVFSPWAEARPNPSVRARGAVDVRLHGPTFLESLADADDAEKVQAVSLRVPEAWVGTRGDHLDLRMGAQRVAWGMGQGVSVVDNVNPWNLEDPLRFDRRLSTPSILARIHDREFELQAVASPFFVPTALPVENVDLFASATDLFDISATGAGNVSIGELDTRETFPTDTIWETTVGARLRWTPAWADLALSWLRGPDPLPQVGGDVVLLGYQTDTQRVDVGVPILFPTREILGGELRTTVGESAIWAEVALNFNQRTAAAATLAQLEALQTLGTIEQVPDPIPEFVTQDGEPYAKWILGADRFIGGVYLNLQWLHGFPTERQAADLRDYVLLVARHTPVPTVRLELSGALDVGPGVELPPFSPAGTMLDFEVGWLHADAAELFVGVSYVGGFEGSRFLDFEGVSHVRTGAALSF